MEGELRSSVGFLGGGGVTPSPTPAEPNLFYRVCPVDDIATPVIVDENGEVCYVDHDGDFSVLRYNVATGAITEDATDAVMTACESFTGGGSEIGLSTDASGNTVYTNGDYHIAVNNSGAIVEGSVSVFNCQDVIAVVGAVQVFADEGCTKYAKGDESTYYVRLNRAFGNNEQKSWGDGMTERESLTVYTPTTQYPNSKYSVHAYIDYSSIDYDEAFTAGQIVACTAEPATLNNLHIIFRDE